MKKSIIVLALLAFYAFSSFAQVQPTSINKGRILSADGQKMKFYHLLIGDSSHRYQTSASSAYLEFPSSKTVRIEQQYGSEALKWAGVFGLSGLAGSLLGVAGAKNDLNGYGTTDVNVAPIVIGLTAACALIGAAIGSGKKKYKSVYSNPKYNIGLYAPRMQLDVAFAQHRSALRFRYVF